MSGALSLPSSSAHSIRQRKATFRHWHHYVALKRQDSDEAETVSYLQILCVGQASKSGEILTGIHRDVLKRYDRLFHLHRHLFSRSIRALQAHR